MSHDNVAIWRENIEAQLAEFAAGRGPYRGADDARQFRHQPEALEACGLPAQR